MSDLIDRQVIIGALDALCDRECEYSQKQRSFMCGACRLGSAFDVIDELPSVQPQRWIPVTEALPDKDGDYLVTYDAGFAEDYEYGVPIGIAPFEVDCEGFGMWHERFDPYTLGSLGSDWFEIKVVAWMPLPEPYAERRQE